ncbi:MAG TPA: GGDEF domain-containing protein [Gaiellaceae bacterium]|jgi:diguanylate cyclase (GGDEF)-like protein
MRRDHVPPARRLAREAAGLELGLVVATVALAAALSLPVSVDRDDWIAFAVLLPIIVLAHLVGADRTKHQGSHLSLAPFFAAVLILPPVLATLAIALAFLPEWLRTRADWYIVLFNFCNFVAPGLVARLVFDAASPSGPAEWALSAGLAIAAFLTLHYGLLAAVLHLARGVGVRDTVRPDCLVIDAGLLSLGAIAAALWESHPGLVALTLLPMGLAYRSLAIPALVEATRIEPKTGLYNLRHFRAALAQELGRAGRFDRSIALLMVDVDHLREINTAHGHLAGDRALEGVAGALRLVTREYDVPARFGGDEFCVLLPETDLEGALVVAERVRALVEESRRGSDAPVTVSVGVVAHEGTGTTPDELIALADRAAYRAKWSGRNAVAVPPEGDPVGEAERLLAG